MESYTGDTIEIFPLKGYRDLIVFQNRHDLEVAVNAYPEKVVPLIGAGKSSADDDFPNTFIALRKCAEDHHCTEEHTECRPSSS